MSTHPQKAHTHEKRFCPPFQEGLNERGELWGEGLAAAVAGSQRQVDTECRAQALPFPPTSKGLCTNNHYCSVRGSLKHCHRDRGRPFQTPGLFCSTTMMGKLHQATHSSSVKDLDLSVNPPCQRWSHTRIKKHHIMTNSCLWFQHLTYPRCWCEPQKKGEDTMSFFVCFLLGLIDVLPIYFIQD